MPIGAWILIAAAIVLGAVLVLTALTKRRTTRLRERFGTEYDRVVEQRGRRRQAEADHLRIALTRYRSFFNRLLSA